MLGLFLCALVWLLNHDTLAKNNEFRMTTGDGKNSTASQKAAEILAAP